MHKAMQVWNETPTVFRTCHKNLENIQFWKSFAPEFTNGSAQNGVFVSFEKIRNYS